MIRRLLLPSAIILGASLAAGVALSTEQADDAPTRPTPAQIEFFEKKVRPVLANNCFKCHVPKKQKGGLRLDSRATILKGGETGPAVVPGKPERSELILAVSYDPDGYQIEIQRFDNPVWPAPG